MDKYWRLRAKRLDKVVKEITKDAESSLRFLKEAGIVGEDGKLIPELR